MILKTSITLAAAITTISAAAVEKRIIGGEEAKDGDFPSIVSISLKAQGHHTCGGTLLDSTTVLTAAHCVNDAYYVRAGVHDVSSTGLETAVVGKLAFVKEHPEFKVFREYLKSYTLDDIGILKLSTPIAESAKIKYAKLPEDGSDPEVNSTAVVAGWGGNEVFNGPEYVDKLLKAVISVHPREVCAKKTPNIAGKQTIVCAGGDGKGTWRHDSGGPLIDQETGLLIGIVAAGGDPEEPGLYIRVGSYIPFIKEYLGSVSNPDANAPLRTEAYEKLVEAQESWDKQVEEHCQRTGQDFFNCRDEAKKCKALRKPDGNMDQVYPCIDKKMDEFNKWGQSIGQ